MTLASGTAFAGYRIEAEIGRGGMGVVYRALDTRLDRPVALKLIAPELAEDPRFRERFLRESRLAASLDHPHVVPIFEAGEHDGRLFIAMRYVEGEDLKDLLVRVRTLEPERALTILDGVAGALDSAHRKGLVHRDVKPGNILLDESEHAYLGDFGLSKRGATSTQSDGIAGTLDYLAPEQIRGETVEGRTDQYGLACVLYGCLAGKPPFRRGTEAETLWAHMQEEPDAPPGYPALAPVFTRALGKEKEQRYETCSDLVAAASATLGLETPARRGKRILLSRRLLLAGGALVVAAAVAAAVIELTGGGSAGIARVSANSLAAIDPETNRVVAATPVGSGPIAVAVGEGAVWVANAADQTVSRVEPRTKEVVRTIGTGRTPSAIAVGEGAVWVANAVAGNGVVVRIEPTSNTVVQTTVTRRGTPDFFAPPAPSAIAVGAGRVWANSNPRGLLASVSSSTGAVRRPVFVGRSHSVDGIAVGEGAVWASSSADDAVLRLAPDTSRVTATIPVAAAGIRVAGPNGIAVGHGSVWVADSLANTVSRIDPRLRAVVATIRVGLRPTNVAVGEGAVWALNRGEGTVSRIDSKTNAVTATIAVGKDVAAIAAGAGAVWVTVAGSPGAAARTVAPMFARPLPASSCSPVAYGGPGRPRFLIASDLPRIVAETPSRVTAQMSLAIRLVLAKHGFRAGRYTVGYQSCDDSSKAEGQSDAGRCAANARMFAANPSLLGLVGPYHSFCTAVELPITNASPSGPLATISPSNSYVGLTASGPATTPLEPDQYYPTGVRSYTRLIGNDQAQGAADAILARQLGLHRIYLLDDGSGTAVADSTYTARALARLGLRVVGRATWRPPSTDFRALARQVARARPDGVYVAGYAHELELFRDLRAVLGTRVTFFAPDNVLITEDFYGHSPTAGLYVSVGGEPLARLGPAGKHFLAAFEASFGEAVAAADVVASAQAAEILLGAIARSNGTRGSVVNELLGTRVTNGLLGSFAFNRNGDPTRSAFTIYRFAAGNPTKGPPYETLADQGGVVDRVLVAPPSLAEPLGSSAGAS